MQAFIVSQQNEGKTQVAIMPDKVIWFTANERGTSIQLVDNQFFNVLETFQMVAQRIAAAHSL